MTKKTFKQIYEELDPTPPKMRWIQRIAKATMRSELTVRMWLNGRQIPEPLVQNIIANCLVCTRSNRANRHTLYISRI